MDDYDTREAGDPRDTPYRREESQLDHEPAPKPFWLDVQVWARDIIISVAIAAVVIVFLYQPVKVEGTSMMPWLVDQERIFVNKFVYRFDEIRRGDVIVFRFPLDPSKSYIKRGGGPAGGYGRDQTGPAFDQRSGGRRTLSAS